MPLTELRKRYPWPTTKPAVAADYHRTRNEPTGWCAGQNRKMLADLLSDKTQLVVDGGSWLGLSAWWMLKLAPNATVVCIDHWKGSREHQGQRCADVLPILYETFCVNLWESRKRIVPMRTDSIVGMEELNRLGLSPDVIYVDWSHDTPSVVRDVRAALALFPRAVVCGDDWTWLTVRTGVEAVVAELELDIQSHTTCWRIMR